MKKIFWILTICDFILTSSLAVTDYLSPDSSATLFREKSGHRAVLFYGIKNECQIFGDFNASELEGVQRENEIQIDKKSMTRLINLCQGIHQELFEKSDDWSSSEDFWGRGDNSGTSNAIGGNFWSFDILSRLLIFPGTKWCGKGAVAESYDDLGIHKHVDSCCRSHDLCTLGEAVGPGECRNGLCNHSPVTRSSCDCDAQFARCLQDTKSKIGNTIGRIFFNYAGLTCYKYDHPIKRCNELFDVTNVTRLPLWILRTMQINPEPHRPRCRRYELDLTKPKRWQYFETVYDEIKVHEEPRVFRQQRGPDFSDSNTPGFFQKMFMNFVMRIFDPAI